MSDTRSKRLKKELLDLQSLPDGVKWCKPVGDNLEKWSACVDGPPNSPYEGGQFQLEITFGPDYPFKPPTVLFKTRVYHCNISSSGAICLDMLKSKWSPAYSVGAMLIAIQSLLMDPNPEDPLVPSLAVMYKEEKEKYILYATKWTERYATKKE